MEKIKDITGQKFNRLTAIRPDGKAKNRCFKWLCKCECGNTVSIEGTTLRSGRQKSCGCANFGKKMPRAHGHTADGKTSRTYCTWATMVQRCTNPNNPQYKNYGGRGITICSEWMKFENFLADMGEKPSRKTIDRIDNNGNYEPSNCRWATAKAQANNKRSNRIIKHNGKEMTVSEWADYLGIRHCTLRMRLHRNWTIERALSK